MRTDHQHRIACSRKAECDRIRSNTARVRRMARRSPRSDRNTKASGRKPRSGAHRYAARSDVMVRRMITVQSARARALDRILYCKLRHHGPGKRPPSHSALPCVAEYTMASALGHRSGVELAVGTTPAAPKPCVSCPNSRLRARSRRPLMPWPARAPRQSVDRARIAAAPCRERINRLRATRQIKYCASRERTSSVGKPGNEGSDSST